MGNLKEEAAAFVRAKTATVQRAGQTAALFIMAGIDLADALNADAAERTRIVARLERMIERERQRGARRHWSYDLNRHIALKQALDKLDPSRPKSQKPKQKRRLRAPSPQKSTAQSPHASRRTSSTSAVGKLF